MPSSWWEPYIDVVPTWFRTFLTLESTASRIRTYESQYVPGLFQTPAYARAVFQLAHTDPEDVERRVELRQARQRLLDNPDAPPVLAVIAQNAIIQPPLTAGERLAQVDHLIALAARPGITIVITESAGDASPAAGAFTILQFSDPASPDLVYVEHADNGQYLDDPAEVALYSGIIDTMTALPESAAATHELLRSMRADL
jgi:hypothetical protein